MKPTEAELRDLYENQRLTTHAIAAQCGVSHMSVKRWLRAYGIKARPVGRGLLNRGVAEPTRDDLYRFIHVEHLGYREVAALYGVDSTAVPYWLRKHGIKRPTIWDTRRKGIHPTLPTAEELTRLYTENLFSIRRIGHLYGVSETVINRLCDEYGIKRRRDGWDGGKRVPCADGHVVRSIYEQWVDHWLYQHEVPHEIEPALPDRRYHADFRANGWYIEVWGVTNSASYEARKKRKLALYRAHNLPLIQVPVTLFDKRRSRYLEQRIARCLTSPQPLRAPQVLLQDSLWHAPQPG